MAFCLGWHDYCLLNVRTCNNEWPCKRNIHNCRPLNINKQIYKASCKSPKTFYCSLFLFSLTALDVSTTKSQNRLGFLQIIRRRGKLSMETLAYFISKARCLSNAKAESITDESLESNCSIIENISPKGVSFFIFYCYLCHVCIVWYIFWFATLR